ncbi:putative secreted protein [Rhodopirellula sp. SWK7]|nr:putative secreted protein [Rhodopirellula sp. SWK7]
MLKFLVEGVLFSGFGKKAMKILWLMLLGCVLSVRCLAQPCDFQFEYVGRAVQTKGMHVWGSSPVIGPDGKVHLYVARWSMTTRNDFNGWYRECEIAHYVGDKPEGPFEFVRVAVPDQDGKFNSPHNPSIKKIDGKYVLCFIVNENDDLTTQRIVMYVADDLSDNWKPAAGAESDGTIVRNSTEPTDWNYTARLGVSNPSLIKHNGKYLLYVKSVVFPWANSKKRKYMYGVTVSDTLEGPYKNHPKYVTPATMPLEDAYAFSLGDSVYMLSRDFGASKGSSGGGLLWKSKNGFHFDKKDVTRAYEDLAHYVGEESLRHGTAYRGKLDGHLERAQVLAIDGQPAYLYLATGVNTTPGHGSCSHVFRMKKRDD